ncbi:MAG: hypothetical protein QOG53_879 [Frankiales bacterium]|jgi:hypothetical protein|nr:hypothetical protein [Frankiales bacterium]
MIWLVVALIAWPVLSLLVGLFLGRGLARCNTETPAPMPELWARRSLPASTVAPLPPHRRQVG